MVRHVPFVALAAALFAVPAFAQDGPSTKFYAALDLGRSQTGASDYVYGRVDGPNEHTSEAFRARVGYQFIRYFAVEAGYSDLGEFEDNNIDMDCPPVTVDPCVEDFSESFEYRGPFISAVGSYTFGDMLTVRASLGTMLRRKSSHTARVDGTGHDSSAEKGTTILGFGLGVPIGKRFEISADWTRIEGVSRSLYTLVAPGEVINEADTQTFWLGGRWRF